MSFSKSLFTLFFAFTLLLTFTKKGIAQEGRTLFGQSVSYGIFGAPSVKIGSVDGGIAFWAGARGGLIINFGDENAFSLGAGGYGLVSNHLAPEAVQPGVPGLDYYPLNLYGGLILEYTNRSIQKTHFTVSALAGAGGLKLRNKDFETVAGHWDKYIVFEPGLHAEMNITHFFRISAGFTYRITGKIDQYGYTNDDFSGLNGELTFKFGRFL